MLVFKSKVTRAVDVNLTEELGYALSVMFISQRRTIVTRLGFVNPCFGCNVVKALIESCSVYLTCRSLVNGHNLCNSVILGAFYQEEL